MSQDLPVRRERLKRDEARLWRVPFLGGLDVLQARYVKQAFARHTHEVFTIGVVWQGAAEFWNRGAEHVAPSGSVMLINPDEVNTGHSFVDDGYVHLVLYPSAEQLRAVARQVMGKRVAVPYFGRSVEAAPDLARQLTEAHRVLAAPGSSLLARETVLQDALATLITSLGDEKVAPSRVGRERAAVRKVRAYLDEFACEDLSLDDLARLSGLSPFHLTRVFRQEVGLPPHAYQVQTRVRRAQGWITAGWSLTEVAHAAGFNDQSAFTNQFKRHVGVTPGQYARTWGVTDPQAGRR